MAILRRKGGPKPCYGNNETNKLTVKVHHGGHIVFDYGGLRYAGGEIRYFDWVSKNRVNLLLLHNFANQLGYPRDVEIDYWFNKLKFQGQLLEFKPIFTNEDVVTMCSTLDDERVAYLYMVQAKTLTSPLDYTNSFNKHVCNTHSAIIISDGPNDSKAEDEFEEVQGNDRLVVQYSTDLSSNDRRTGGLGRNMDSIDDRKGYWDRAKNQPMQWGRGEHGSSSRRADVLWDVNNIPLHEYANVGVDESDDSVNVSLSTMASQAK